MAELDPFSSYFWLLCTLPTPQPPCAGFIHTPYEQPAYRGVLIGREVCPWEDRPREGAGAVAESRLWPFGQGILESQFPEYGLEGCPGSGWAWLLGPRGLLAYENGHSWRRVRVKPFKVQGLGQGPC